MKIHFIKSSKKKKIISKLDEQFGISKLPNWLLIESGKEKIRAFSGSLSKDEILELNKLTCIESLGLYIIKSEKGKDLRLTLDSSHLLKSKISKNIIEITSEQLNEWLHGRDISLPAPAGVMILSHKRDLVGVGVSNTQKIYNYLPKERRLKN